MYIATKPGASFISLKNTTWSRFWIDLICQLAIQAKYGFLLVSAQFLQQTVSLQTPNTAHILKLLAPSSKHQQYHAQIHRNLLLFFPGLLADGTNRIIKLQSTCSAKSEEQPISALSLMVIVANELSQGMQMRIGEGIWSQDAQRLAISSKCTEEQLLGNHVGNQL
jgi:hypothetical protein